MPLPRPGPRPLAALLCALLLLGGAVPARAGPGGSGRDVAPGPFRWPLDGTPRVARPFVPPPTPYGRGHRGVDLAATPGAVVRAAGPGVVSFAGPVGGRGVVVVRHDGGLRTTYEPVVPRVRAGAAVRAGDPLGVLAAGHPGCATSACLHWGLLRGSVYLDPLALLGLGAVRLWPLQPGDAPAFREARGDGHRGVPRLRRPAGTAPDPRARP
ncbi:MAG: peptidase, partial [Cryptosporangiaceae bacterium]|nr:peptidase [Cryptosporangiaceae bacterium]